MQQGTGHYLVPWQSIGLLRQRGLLRAFLDTPLHVAWPGRKAQKTDAWVGWGRRPSGRRAERRARQDGCGLLLLEDGFIRSLGLGLQGAAPISIVADTTGIHYDATAPSDIETMLASVDFSREEREKAAALITCIRNWGLSKYNLGLPVPENAFPEDEERVLVVDQTAGDLSLALGLADGEICRRLFEAALDENPDATIYVKTHPDVLVGQRRGVLPRLQDRRIRWIHENWHPHDLLIHFGKVYVATSLMGLDALLLGRKVRCFGLPFYAGWGLTEDEQKASRRGRQRTLEDLVVAAFFRYARYRDPVTGRPCDAFAALERLAEQKRHYRFWAENVPGPAWNRRVHAFGFRLWKQPHIRRFLGEGVQVIFSRSLVTARLKGLRPGDRIAVWGLRDPKGLQGLASQLGTRIVRVEDGFIRSVGLGSDFRPALSLVFDDMGIYFDPDQKSRLEHILETTVFNDELRERAARLRQEIVQHGLTKYNFPRRQEPQWGRIREQGRRVILVPGQVEDDASILKGGAVIRTNRDLLSTVRTENPDAFIVYKPHPELLSGNRSQGHVDEARRLADHIETETDIISCIEHSDEVHTITSLSGFDALLRGRRVVTYGRPFYAGWGLTEDRADIPGRRRELSIDELVAGALILYPRYVLPAAEGFAKPEEVVEEIKNALLHCKEENLHMGEFRAKLFRRTRLLRLTMIGAVEALYK